MAWHQAGKSSLQRASCGVKPRQRLRPAMADASGAMSIPYKIGPAQDPDDLKSTTSITRPTMHIVPLYAALLALLFVGLSVRTLRMRRRLRIAVGDAANPVMLRAMRAHANFAEYVPLGLMLIFLVESSGASNVLVHVLGASLLVGRMLHGYGVSQLQENFSFRVAGMMLTLTPLIVAAVRLLFVFASSAQG
jgi:uncharacterized membrane protein YecN with MAPEG domain